MDGLSVSTWWVIQPNWPNFHYTWAADGSGAMSRIRGGLASRVQGLTPLPGGTRRADCHRSTTSVHRPTDRPVDDVPTGRSSGEHAGQHRDRWWPRLRAHVRELGQVQAAPEQPGSRSGAIDVP